jgi:hypothetical protein
MTRPTDFMKRFRSYRSSIYEFASLFILVAVTVFANQRGRLFVEREKPKIAVLDSALVRLSRIQDTTRDEIDPQVRELAVQRRDLASELNKRLNFWTNVRMICSLTVILLVVSGVFRFVGHMIGIGTDEKESPTRISPGQHDKSNRV